MSDTQKILIVDDDPHIREVVCFALKQAGYTVVQASDGPEAINLTVERGPDLIILDINLPGKDGFQTCKEIREFSQVPILFLSSRAEEIDRILGFELGGDDYVVKPFSPREVVARATAILKRPVKQVSQKKERLSFHGLVLDRVSHQVRYHNQEIELSATEFQVLACLMTNPEKVYSKEELITKSYKDQVHVSSRTLDSHIRNVRKKLKESDCPDFIKTIRAVGYTLRYED